MRPNDEPRDKSPGTKPPQIGFFKREVIGPPDCPLMYRWTILNLKFVKLLVHRFLPDADDLAVHDHPRPFVTIILSGGYDDLQPCPCQDDTSYGRLIDALKANRLECPYDCNDGLILGDRLRRGAIRYRSAEHKHRTQVGPKGCWSICIMGPLVRVWGFWHRGRFFQWQEYEERYGYTMRCP